MDTTNETVNTIDEYIATFPKEVQTRLTQLRKIIHEAAPDVVESINYKMAAFKVNGKYVGYFAAFKNHIGYYPFPSGIAAFKKESVDFTTSKGTIQFPHDKPIPFDLVSKMVKYMVAENAEKAKSKTKKSSY
jgi:uncharacterized protein YdhG (YjbR/CyaY superfamily)